MARTEPRRGNLMMREVDPTISSLLAGRCQSLVTVGRVLPMTGGGKGAAHTSSLTHKTDSER